MRYAYLLKETWRYGILADLGRPKYIFLFCCCLHRFLCHIHVQKKNLIHLMPRALKLEQNLLWGLFPYSKENPFLFVANQFSVEEINLFL